MSGVIEVSKDASWIVAGWVYRAATSAIRRRVPTEAAPEFHEALATQDEGALEYLDWSNLPSAMLRLFARAVDDSVQEAERDQGASWSDPEFFPGYLERLREFQHLLHDAVRDRA